MQTENKATYSYTKDNIQSDHFSVQWFKLGKTKTPILQPWQIELQQFRKEHPILALPAPKEKVENYMKLSTSWASIVAQAINPVVFFFFLIVEVLMLVFNNPTSVVWWIFTVLLSIPFIYSATAVLRQCIYEMRVKNHEAEIETNIYVDNTEGAPGAGKTSSVINDAKILADIRWDEICQEYEMLKPFLADIPHWPQKEREDAEEIIETYEYYQTTGTYPCLWTSFAVFVEGIPANQFTVDHILQRKRIPYNSVIAVDEFNLFIPQNIYRDTPYEIIEISKFCRQWGFSFKIADQSTDGTVIYFRRVSGRNRYMLEQEWVLQPRLLKWILKKTICSKKELTKKQVNFCKGLQKIIRASGYRKYYYVDTGTVKYKNDNARVETFVLRSNLNVEYDDRAFKNLYRCKNQKLEVSAWKNLRMDKSELAKIFPEELRERAKSKSQLKREARERYEQKLKEKQGVA